MIIFTSDTFHAGVKAYEHKSGAYPARLRLFAYIVKNNKVSITDEVYWISNANKCITSCSIYYLMPNDFTLILKDM